MRGEERDDTGGHVGMGPAELDYHRRSQSTSVSPSNLNNLMQAANQHLYFER